MSGPLPSKFKKTAAGLFQERALRSRDAGASDARHAASMWRGDGARTPEAAFDLGMRYSMGNGMSQDHREAARYFRLAADKGHMRAQFSIALCYDKGEGVLQNHSEAARYYRLAADQGHALAQFNVADQAARYIHLAADQGEANAQCAYAQLCLQGVVLPQNWGEGARYHRLAADQGCAPSQLALGAMLIDDEHAPADVRALEPADPRAGARLLARAAQSVGADNASHRLQALGLLRHYADQREVASACCTFCGATEGLKQCTRCHVARFCGSACMRQMWPTHKQCCKAWQDEQGDESQQ
jgi:TPR repeat protein